MKEKDPAYYETVDRQNPRRLIRALEVIKQTGKPYSGFRQKKPDKRNFEVVKIGLYMDKELLRNRIDLRIEEMFSRAGWKNAKVFFHIAT